MTNLWPDNIGSGSTKMKPPVAILREQASLLGERTQNMVTASVNSVQGPSARPFRSGFMLLAPALGNYAYRLFSIEHGIELYPVVLDVDDDILMELPSQSRPVQANSEAEFLDLLRRIFASRKTRQIIDVMLAQSLAVGSD